ncbi:MAG TPA: N-acetylmuramoyl-L-alanine amidase [Bacteroidota bacterium]
MDPRRITLPLCVLLPPILLSSCSSPLPYVKPRDWAQDSARAAIITSASNVLAGRRIFLDPGHGGDDRVNRGPAGEAIEADVNLRVALALRDYLRGAGVTVFMSRMKDTTIDLRERVRLAVASGAEMFISMHHNATGTGDNVTNYSSVYYHSKDGMKGYHPANHDLARYIERDMAYAMRNAPPPFSTTFDGTLSDYDIYPNAGFAVLRDNPLPAVLIEASFFTHPPEERRLAAEDFNSIEAWGIFLGITKYFRAGIPQVVLFSDTIATTPTPVLKFGMGPARTVDPATFLFYVDGQVERRGLFVRDSTAVWTAPAELTSGAHTIAAVVSNNNGNHSWPFRRPLNVMLPAVEMMLKVYPTAIPPLIPVPVKVAIRARDTQGRPVADRTLFHIESSAGPDTALSSTGGRASATLNSSASREELRILVRSGSARAAGMVPRTATGSRCIAGLISSQGTFGPVAGAAVTLVWPLYRPAGSVTDTAGPDGQFVICERSGETGLLHVQAPGFFTSADTVAAGRMELQHNMLLEPIGGGVLAGKPYVIDARYGGADGGETGPGGLRAADVNLKLALRVVELLKAAGAEAFLMREDTTDIPEQERIRRSTLFPPGRYVRIDAAAPNRQVRAVVYSNPSNRAFGSALQAAVGQWGGLDTAGVSGSEERFYRDVAMSTTSLILPSVTTGYYESLDRAVDVLAWGIFTGMLRAEGGGTGVIAGVVRQGELQAPAPFASVTLNGTLRQVADGQGRFMFPSISKSPRLTVEGIRDAMIVQPASE